MKHKKLLIIAFAVGFLSLFSYAPAAHGNWCEDMNRALNFNLADCADDEIVSFTGFQSELQAPSGEGLSPTLTHFSDVKSFIRGALNFALTFLGIIALAIVIYGGFLYVTSAGKEEQATSGKKAVTYALVGILLIIGSFAIVNTLLHELPEQSGQLGQSAGGAGPGDGTGRGVGAEGHNAGQQGLYSLGAAQINSALSDFVSAYRNYSEIASVYKRLEALPGPSDDNMNRQYLAQVTSMISQIKNASPALSLTNQRAQRFLDEYLSQFASYTNEQMEELNDVKTNIMQRLNDAQYNIRQSAEEDYNSAIDLLIGTNRQSPPRTQPAANNQDDEIGKIPMVWKIMGEVAANAGTPAAINRNLTTNKDIERAFAGIDPNITVGQLFVDAISALHNARQLVTEQGETEPRLLLEASKTLYRLYIVVKDIQFVYVQIDASEPEGNAPFVVELRGLNSRDPTGQTIPQNRYEWDPDGDGAAGIANTENVECPNVNFSTAGPTIVCTYKHTGTYRVRLGIVSADPNHIAKGFAVKSITVKPPTARIKLKAWVSNATPQYLRNYQDRNGRQEISTDINEFQVTTNEAMQNGINFDACESRDGQNRELMNYSWNFNDTKPIENGRDKCRVTHKYPSPQRYRLNLEVTDSGGRKDRKFADIVISSLVARINALVTATEPDETLEFDGSTSRSDQGQITSYSWKIKKTDGAEVTNDTNYVTLTGNAESPILRARFNRPGIYKVELRVSDATSQATSSIDHIVIRSRPPRASFIIRSCPQSCPDQSQPGLAELDANGSSDPDQNDVLAYEWRFFNSLGDEISAPTNMTTTDALRGEQAKKVRVKFNNIGNYKVKLIVTDSNGQNAQALQEIRQENTKEKTFEIKSVVEARWSANMQTSAAMENGSANFVLEGDTLNANRVQIDFGDSQSDEQTFESTNQGHFRFEHAYTQAGSYYVVLRALSDSRSGETVINKRIRVGAGNAPLAAMTVYMDNQPIILPDPSPTNPSPSLEIIRRKPVKFDATASINSSGQRNSGLRYSWDFGDNKRSTGATVNHSYSDVSPVDSPFTVRLAVTETADPSKTNEEEFRIRVTSKKPTVNNLSVKKKSQENTTPIDAEVTAEGASDEDGTIRNFQFWYFDPADKDRKLAVTDTAENRTVLTVETAGEANEEHEYLFCVKVTDNENSSSDCEELFDENELPRMRVVNGPNKAPLAVFTADKTSAKVNETVVFTSSSRDEDGRIAQYIWDLDGDGFQNDQPSEQSTATKVYERKSPEGGFRIKLKVIDDKGAAGYSSEIPIYITTRSSTPTAGFDYTVVSGRQVQFDPSIQSRADTVNGARLTKWNWTFDIGCGRQPMPPRCSNPNEMGSSTETSPVYEFPNFGTYEVTLRVEDSNGNASTPVVRQITVSEMAAGQQNTPNNPPPIGNQTNSNMGNQSNNPPIGGAASNTGGANNNQTPPSYRGVSTSPTITSPPAVEAHLTTIPAARFALDAATGMQRKSIHVPENQTNQQVTFFFNESKGDIKAYLFDRNKWCDSDGDGKRLNDTDSAYVVDPNFFSPNNGTSSSGFNLGAFLNPRTNLASPQFTEASARTCTVPSTGRIGENCWTIPYNVYDKTRQSAPGVFTAVLTVIDSRGRMSTDEVDIVFDKQINANEMRKSGCGGISRPALSNLSANLFRTIGARNTILLGMATGVIVILTIFGISGLFARGKIRRKS